VSSLSLSSLRVLFIYHVIEGSAVATDAFARRPSKILFQEAAASAVIKTNVCFFSQGNAIKQIFKSFCYFLFPFCYEWGGGIEAFLVVSVISVPRE
jgi:hypothetical protein